MVYLCVAATTAPVTVSWRSCQNFFDNPLSLFSSSSSLHHYILHPIFKMTSNMTMSSGFQTGYGTSIWSPNLTPMSEPEYIGALIGLFILSVGFRALVAAQGYLEAYLHLHYYPRPSSYSSSSSSSSSPYSRAQTHTIRHSQQQHHHQAITDIQELEEAVETRESTLGFVDEKNNGTNAIVRSENLQDQEFHRQGVQPVREEEEGEGVTLHHQGPLRATPEATSTATAVETGITTTTARHRRYGAQRHHIPPLYYPHHNNNDDAFFPLPTAQPFVWQAEVSRAVLTTGVVGIGYMLMLVIMTYNSAYFGVILAGVFVGEVYFGRWGRVRPIFPSSSSQRRSRAACQPQQQQQQPGQQQQQQQAVGSTIPSSFNKNNNSSYIDGNGSQRPAASSMTSLASRSSSQGYSSAMIPHGTSADGAC
ncbi:Ctr copper transporter family-domain-containing protein [Dissophora ornata]|nr:Ctr copper transporter family-domain-containing protein [Dissophora ornata]